MSGPAAPPESDAGMSLIEIMVAMSIMGAFLAMFTTGILQVYRGVDKTESMTTAQAQLNTAFLRLDREIRYAAGLSTPGTVGANPYVEYMTTNTGVPVCTELRLNTATRQLQRRTWSAAAPPAIPTAWVQLAAGVTASQAFTVLGPDDTASYQRLRVRLTVVSGGATTATTKQVDVSFTALNTSVDTDSGTVCSAGRSIA